MNAPPSRADLETILDQAIGRHRLVGASAALASGDRIVWSGVAGSPEAGSNRPIPPEPILRIASITKLLTASAVMLLRDRGALSLDDEVRHHVPELAVDGVTIGEFLCHGSGLQRETPDDPGWQTGAFLMGDDFLAALARARVVLPPMTRWKYSNLAYNALGLVVERATGAPYAAFVNRELIEPIGLVSTTVGRPEGAEDRLIPGHQRVPATNGVMIDASWRDPVPGPAGGVWSTAADVARLGVFLVGALRGPLSAETLGEMRRPRLMVDDAWHLAHGLGPMLFRHDDGVLVGHAGDVAGFSGWMLASPRRGVSAACLANVMDAGELLPIVLELLGEAPSAIEVVDEGVPLVEERPVGTFAGDGSVIVLSSVSEGMVARWPGAEGPLDPGAVHLLPTGRDRFMFVDGGPYLSEELILERDDAGRITACEACTYRFERIDPA